MIDGGGCQHYCNYSIFDVPAMLYFCFTVFCKNLPCGQRVDSIDCNGSKQIRINILLLMGLFGGLSVLEGLSTVVSYGPSFSVFGIAVRLLCGGGRDVVESQIDNRAIVFVTLYITAAVLRTRVLGPILGGIYCAIHGGDMCAVKKRGGRAYCEQCPIDGPNYYRPLLLMH